MLTDLGKLEHHVALLVRVTDAHDVPGLAETFHDQFEFLDGDAEFDLLGLGRSNFDLVGIWFEEVRSDQALGHDHARCGARLDGDASLLNANDDVVKLVLVLETDRELDGLQASSEFDDVLDRALKLVHFKINKFAAILEGN